jgi:hypothetical protein
MPLTTILPSHQATHQSHGRPIPHNASPIETESLIRDGVNEKD